MSIGKYYIDTRQIQKLLCVMIVIVLVAATFQIFTYSDTSAQPVLSKLGSRSNEVKQIQSKLRELGMYNGSVDGIFGPVTRSAVITFQKSVGLTADGIAGPVTLKYLGLQSSTASTGAAVTSNNINILAHIISAEAKGEAYVGMVAVGAVILNRVKHPSFPNTIAGVVYQPGAFSPVDNGSINQEPVPAAYNAARDALNGSDPSGGAIYFYNPAKTTNAWLRSRPVTCTIGSHTFAK